MIEYPELSAYEKALHKAVEEGRLDEVKQLVSEHYDLRAKLNSRNPDKSNSTLIHIAAKSGHVALCHYLMTVGSLPYLRNCEGFTPANLASDSGHHELAEFLKGAERNPPQMLEEFLPVFISEEIAVEESAA